MAARSGLVSYGGDSEISDSEDERTPVNNVSTESSTSIIGANDLGIPSSAPQPVTTPPALPAVVVEAAPTTLVDYTMHEDDEEHNESRQGEEGVDEEESDSIVPLVETGTSETLDGEEVNSMEVEDDIVPLYLRTTDVVLPPEPTAKCSKSLQNKIIALLQKRASSGVDLNSSLQSRKDIRNPSILEKLVQFCDLKEFGTNYPEHIYNPNEFTEESMYDKLYQQQKESTAKKEKAKLNAIKFIKGTKKPVQAQTTVIASAQSADKGVKKARKTKWDIGSAGGTDSGGSRGASPSSTKDRPALLGAMPPTIPIGLQPRVVQSAVVGAQARAQATQIKQELKKALN